MRHRRFRANPAKLPGRPRTTVGLFIRASALEDQNTRLRFSSQLNGGRDGWNDDEPAVARAACELALTRLFGGVYDAAEVQRYLSDLYSRWQSVPDQAYVSQEAAVQVVRDALGEPGDLSGLSPLDLLAFRTLLTAVACASLAMSAAEVEQLIAEAEGIAFERGWNPPLASSVG